MLRSALFRTRESFEDETRLRHYATQAKPHQKANARSPGSIEFSGVARLFGPWAGAGENSILRD